MSRSTYIYVVAYADYVGTGTPVLARTVKYELVSVMRHFSPDILADVEVWRYRDEGAAFSGPASRDFLGTGPEFLAKETPPPPKVPCPEGFHWIGQSMATCDVCTLPAWEHAGMAQPDGGLKTPFDSFAWVLEPWKPGEAEACRAKWDPEVTR